MGKNGNVKSVKKPIDDEMEDDLPQQVGEDGPGEYVMTKMSAVKSGISTKSPHIGTLSGDTMVEVLQVVSYIKENRVRGRIKKPPGWISILNIEDGTRWAVKKGQPMPEKVSKKRAAEEAKKTAALQQQAKNKSRS